MRISTEAADAIAAAYAHNKTIKENDVVVLPAVDLPKPGSFRRVRYTNYRGETAVREIVIKSYRFGSSEWHQGRQNLMLVSEPSTGKVREFAVDQVSDWDVPAEVDI